MTSLGKLLLGNYRGTIMRGREGRGHMSRGKVYGFNCLVLGFFTSGPWPNVAFEPVFSWLAQKALNAMYGAHEGTF